MSGLLTVGNEKVREKTAYYLLNEYVRKGNHKSRNRVFIVHRLDKDTSGVIVFAKNINAKRYLQDEWQTFKKNILCSSTWEIAKEGGCNYFLSRGKPCS